MEINEDEQVLITNALAIVIEVWKKDAEDSDIPRIKEQFQQQVKDANKLLEKIGF